MVINEIFYSLQGEGLLAGVPSVFIRLAGCPVKCRWCDSSYAFGYDDGQDLSIEQIAEKVKQYNCSHFVITGGEPLANEDFSPRQGVAELVSFLKQKGGHVTIETAGVVFVGGLNCDLMSISPKLSNSGRDSMRDLDVLQQMLIEYNCQFKFVVEGQRDVVEINKIIDSLAGIGSDKVMLMPQAKSRGEYTETALQIAQLCLKYNFRFSPRLQVLLWNNEPGR